MSRSYKDAVGGHKKREIDIWQGGRHSCIYAYTAEFRRFAKRHESRRQRRLIPALIQLGLEDQSWIDHADEAHWDSIYDADLDFSNDNWCGDWADDFDRYDSRGFHDDWYGDEDYKWSWDEL